MEKLIDINNVSVVYDGKQGSTQAIKDIDLSINKGDFLVLLGPSGCGKSSLLKLIAGFNKPTRGSVEINGHKIEGPNRDRGVVFQSTNLFPWLNVKENVSYGLNLNKMDQATIDSLVDLYLEEVGLEDYKFHYPEELSGGMRQRVAFVRSMINNPKILLMDEPFGALDAITRLNMQDMVRKLWKKGDQTFFLITHDIEEALSLGNRIVVMSHSPGEIQKEYKVDFSQRLENEEGYVATLDPDFMKIREEILHLINVD